MQKVDKPYYKCDFCDKKIFRPQDIAKHEKWCRFNPNNKHICFAYCKHLIKTESDYDGTNSEYGEYTGKKTVFTCAVLNQKMFSFIAERKKLPVIKESDTIRMPLECDKYKAQYTDDFEIFD